MYLATGDVKHYKPAGLYGTHPAVIYPVTDIISGSVCQLFLDSKQRGEVSKD